jgi:hypothetical protein
MLTWAVTIPTFWAVTFRNLREGVFSDAEGARRVGRVGMNWIVVITVASYAIVVVLAQLHMDAIPRVILDLQNLF